MKKINTTPKMGFYACWLPLLIGLCITFVAAWLVNYQHKHQIKVYTNTLANQAERLIEGRFQHFEYGLRGTRGAIVTTGVAAITRKQFENYINSRDIEHEFPGALGFGFIRRVAAAQEAEYVRRARQDGAPNFRIRTLTAHDDDRFVIEYIYPLEKNRQAVGLDIGSERNRRAAALAAARDDKPYLTAPITLVQTDKKARKGALVLLPIYAQGVPLDSGQARQQAVIGWSYAPLDIDQVLSGVEPLTEQAYITLTNLTETEPFYRSHNASLAASSSYQTVRDIFVLGQQWRMALTPSAEAIQQRTSWQLGWVVVFGLGMTLVAIFLLNLVVNESSKEPPNGLTYQLGLRSIGVFLKSELFKRSCLFALLLLIVIFALSSWLIGRSHFAALKTNLLNTTQSALATLDQAANQYSRDVLFLAGTPPVKALQGLAKGQVAAQDAALQQQWYERVGDIFKAYMLSNKNIHQVRFISLHGGWQERVKVQRFGEELNDIPPAMLQSKKDEPYIAQTLQVGAGHVFQSDITLNREFGKVEQPDRPVWRFSTPVFDGDGRPFAMIIVNVSADNILQASAHYLAPETQLYITNQEGDFLLHPHDAKVFTFEYGHPNRWQSEFHPVASGYAFVPDGLTLLSSQQGQVFVEQAVFLLGEEADGRVLNFYSTVSQLSVLKHIVFEICVVLLVIFLIALMSVMIQYWVWLNEKIRHQEDLNAQIEDQRNKETMRFKALLESAPDATLVVNDEGVIQLVNKRAEQIFGYQRDALEGQPIDKLLPDDLRQGHQQHVMDYLREPKTVIMGTDRELLALRADGVTLPVEISLSGVRFDDKLWVSAAVRDISERLAIEEKLRKALRDAELATEAKSAFLANTSHEIRTPLNAIIGLGYLLAEEPLTQAQHQLVSKIQVSGKSLLGIVNDVLDLSKIEANEMQLEAQPLELREFFDEIASVFAIQAQAKHLEFHVEVDTGLPEWVVTDSVRLQQIVTNLLSNALKFTAMGQISLNVGVGEQALAEPMVCVQIRVSDTGIGISAESQARLFKPFTQADSTTTRRFGGTGLGLSIVHQLIALMGGDVRLESSEGVGTTFMVDLPLRVLSEAQVSAQQSQNQSFFVLIAEDDPTDAQQLQNMAQALGWRCEVVSNGTELVNAYLSRQQNKLRPPDVMIVDWQMPIMDGLNAINALTEQVGQDSLPAVLMVSAHDKNSIMACDPEKLVKHFLSKPIHASSLFNAVNDAMTFNNGNAKRMLQATCIEAVGVQWLVNIRVLVVDDSPTNLVVVKHILEHSGAWVQTANSGEEALTLLADGVDDYDAVLMDVQMPGLDGLETTRRIRHAMKISALPIIALTAGALVEEKNRALAAGMNDFLTKPINPSRLISVLRSSVEDYRGKQVAVGSSKGAASPTTAEEWPPIAGLNLEKAKNILLGDKTLFLNTLSGLLVEYANLVEVAKEDIDAPDCITKRFKVASQVHKLRSVSGMVGAEHIQQLAGHGEKVLRTQDEPAKAILQELAQAIEDLQQSSAQVLAQWRQEKRDYRPTKVGAPALEQATVSHLLGLLEAQDLQALAEFEQHRESFREALDEEGFQTLQESLEMLNYKAAVQILTAWQELCGDVVE